MVSAARRTKPTAAEEAIWAQGSRTVRQAAAESGIPKKRIYALVKAGVVRAKVRDEKGTLVILWADLAKYVASLPDGR